MGKIFVLNSENIDVISEEIFKFLQKQKLVKEDVIRARLSVETALMQWLEYGNEGREVMVDCRQRFRRPVIRLVMEGPLCDPREIGELDDAMDFIATLQGNLGLAVVYEYKHGRNVYDVKLPMPEMSTFAKIGVAIAASVVTWQLVGFLPADVGLMLCEHLIEPTFSMLLGLISALATVLVFVSVCSAICGMGDLATLSKLGGRMMKYCQITDLVGVVVGVGTGLLIFDVLDFSGGVSVGLFTNVYKMFLAVVPHSLIGPFVEGNTLQVLFLAVTSGVLLLILGQQAGDLVKVIRQVNLFLMTAINYFCYAVPLMIYLSFTGILLSGQFESIFNTWKVVAACYVVCGVILLAHTGWSAFISRFDLKKHFARIMPISLLAFTTRSTAACIPVMNKTLKDEGVNLTYRDFALPLCQTLAAPGTIITFHLMILGLLGIYHQTISLSALAVLMASIYLVAQAMPPVAGGDISIMTLLLLQVGLPKEAVATYIAMSLFVDMVATCLNKTSVMNAVFTCAKKDGKIKE